MNKPTPGPWVGTTFGIYGEGETPLVADCGSSAVINRHEMGANISLIVAAVNACFAVNPDNPPAVAEAIPEIYHLLKRIIGGYGSNTPETIDEAMTQARSALAKLEAKP